MDISKRLRRLRKPLLEVIYKAGIIAGIRGEKAFLVGGFVRDLLLEIENFDVDIAVDSDTPFLFVRDFAGSLKLPAQYHEQFKTASVIGRNLRIDFAGLRKEIYPYPGSLPTVSRGSLKDDLLRRDFSINSIAVEITDNNFGLMHDPYNGISDLKARLMRVLHDNSFRDDPTRILRLSRFAGRFGFNVEARTRRLLDKARNDKALDTVSTQRIGNELKYILKERFPEKPLALLFRFYPVRLSRSRLRIRPQIEMFPFLRERINWFRKSFPQGRQLSAEIVYAALLFNNIPKTGVKEEMSKFNFNSDEIKCALSFKESFSTVKKALKKIALSPAKIYRLLKPLSTEVVFLIYFFEKDKTVRKNIRYFLLNLSRVRLLVTGEDIKKLGVKPGPVYARIFERLLESKLKSGVKGRRGELELLKEIVDK